MIRDAFTLKTDDIKDVVRIIDVNCAVFADCINDNHRAIYKLAEETEKLMKKTRHKASKLGLFLTVAAGIAYVVKNEHDKQEMNVMLLELDKKQRFSNETVVCETDDSAFI